MDSEADAYCVVTEDGEEYVIYTTSNNCTAESTAVTPSPAVVPSLAADPRCKAEDSEDLKLAIEPQLLKEKVLLYPETLDFWDNDKVYFLLTLTCSHKHSVVIRETDLWKEMGDVVGIGPSECLKKYLSLRNTYLQFCKNKAAGYKPNWIFYEMCKEAFKNDQELSSALDEAWGETKIKLLLELYTDSIGDIQSGSVAKNKVWKDIASKIGNTPSNCHEKYRSLKSTYMKMTNGGTKQKKAKKWPYSSYFETILKSCNTPRWKHEQVRQLLDAFKARMHTIDTLSKKKLIWKEISEVVKIDPENCHHKFRNLKLTYTRLKSQQNDGKEITNWQYFDDFEMISKRVSPMKYKVEEYVKVLLQCYYANKEKFFDPETNKKTLWNEIGHMVGRSASECDVKFRNLKVTYRKVAEVKKQTGIEPQWPYFSYFERIFNEPTKTDGHHIDNITTDDISYIESGVKEDYTEKHEEIHKLSCSNEDNLAKSHCHESCCQRLDRLLNAIEESNRLQRESNLLLKELLQRKLQE